MSGTDQDEGILPHGFAVDRDGVRIGKWHSDREVARFPVPCENAGRSYLHVLHLNARYAPHIDPPCRPRKRGRDVAAPYPAR